LKSVVAEKTNVWPRPNCRVAEMFHKWCRIVADFSQNTEVLVEEDDVTFSNTLPALAGRLLERLQNSSFRISQDRFKPPAIGIS